ncbi:hypothetical protein BDP27DRAFT_407705 [Rhodocollybia butyracea]|uniref:Secreted protein n=1 Tax=Rhodocollybia butyracea TaxID=206335 RepID=A0A9P5TYK8_9AGAR|nr:hypothetical protein BDP27DRAFT_407705 [Rhodocollybia butyracea]
MISRICFSGRIFIGLLSDFAKALSPIQRSHTSWVWTRWKRLFNGFREKPGYAEILASVSLNVCLDGRPCYVDTLYLTIAGVGRQLSG